MMREEDLSRVFHYIGGAIRNMSGRAFIVGDDRIIFMC